MHWVIQDNMYNEEGFHKLVHALERLDLPYSVVKVRPFIHTLEPDINPEGPVIVMGSYSLCYVAQKKGWEPGAFLSELLNYKIQCDMWGKHNMLNGDCIRRDLGQVEPFEGHMFIRPVDDGKSFAGQVMSFTDFKKWQESVLALSEDDNPSVTGDTEIILAKPKEIYSETRCWILPSGARWNVVTASEYKRGTRVTYSDDVDLDIIEFADDLSNQWSPCAAYCMDVARTPDGLKVVECNNINSAGFYAADMQKLVMSLEDRFG